MKRALFLSAVLLLPMVMGAFRIDQNKTGSLSNSAKAYYLSRDKHFMELMTLEEKMILRDKDLIRNFLGTREAVDKQALLNVLSKDAESRLLFQKAARIKLAINRNFFGNINAITKREIAKAAKKFYYNSFFSAWTYQGAFKRIRSDCDFVSDPCEKCTCLYNEAWDAAYNLLDAEYGDCWNAYTDNLDYCENYWFEFFSSYEDCCEYMFYDVFDPCVSDAYDHKNTAIANAEANYYDCQFTNNCL